MQLSARPRNFLRGIASALPGGRFRKPKSLLPLRTPGIRVWRAKVVPGDGVQRHEAISVETIPTIFATRPRIRAILAPDLHCRCKSCSERACHFIVQQGNRVCLTRRSSIATTAARTFTTITTRSTIYSNWFCPFCLLACFFLYGSSPPLRRARYATNVGSQSGMIQHHGRCRSNEKRHSTCSPTLSAVYQPGERAWD